jgi:hypothetical protein
MDLLVYRDLSIIAGLLLLVVLAIAVLRGTQGN